MRNGLLSHAGPGKLRRHKRDERAWRRRNCCLAPALNLRRGLPSFLAQRRECPVLPNHQAWEPRSLPQTVRGNGIGCPLQPQHTRSCEATPELLAPTRSQSSQLGGPIRDPIIGYEFRRNSQAVQHEERPRESNAKTGFSQGIGLRQFPLTHSRQHLTLRPLPGSFTVHFLLPRTLAQTPCPLAIA